MKIGLKSCYLAVLPDSQFSVCVWIFFPIPQDLWLDCCTSGGKSLNQRKVSLGTQWVPLLCSLCWLNNKKTSSPCILHCNFKLQPKHTKSTEEIAIHPPICFIPVIYAPNVCLKWPTLALHHTKRHNIFFSVALRFASMQLTAMLNLKSQPSSSLMERLWNREMKKWSVTWAFALLTQEQHFPESRCNQGLVKVELINRAAITWNIHLFQGWGEEIYVNWSSF